MEVRTDTLNVVTITGKWRELTDTAKRRKVDIFYMQNTRWKRSRARSIAEAVELFYHSVDRKRN